MRTFQTSVIAFIALAILGCGDQRQPELRIDNVVRVFMHEPHRYTLFAQRPETKELAVYEFSIRKGFEYRRANGEILKRCDIRLLADVPNGEPMWATSERWGSSPPGADCVLTIHLHDPTEIDGGGWDHGKFGHGTTHAIE